MPNREAAHPAATSVGTWYKLLGELFFVCDFNTAIYLIKHIILENGTFMLGFAMGFNVTKILSVYRCVTITCWNLTLSIARSRLNNLLCKNYLFLIFGDCIQQMPNCPCLSEWCWGGCGTLWPFSMRFAQSSYGLQGKICQYEAQIPCCCIEIPVLVHWAAIAMFHLALYVYVCVCE